MKSVIQSVILVAGLTVAYVFSSIEECQQKGYPTSCNGTEGVLENGTPCLTVYTGPTFAVAGLCMNGQCAYPNSSEEDKRAHPKQYHNCSDKYNYARMVLFNCYYYCNKSGEWFYGFYNFSTDCHMEDGKAPFGKCCKGECTRNITC
nr:uncharacterized protein LOC129388276 [Dermacentor andersoni]